LGDLVAGSIVVRDRPEETEPSEDAAPLREDEWEPDAPEMSDEEFALLRQFRERLAGLDPDVQTRLAAQLAVRLSDSTTPSPQDDLALLHTLYVQELGRRRGRLATRGAARSRGAVAERFAARKEVRWDEFDALLARATQDGLDHLGADELLDFAARYREIAADLARARTYGATPRVVGRLERSVGTGHNMLYRAERRGIRRVWAVVGRECPAAVVYAWRYVLVGFLLFALPGAAGYAFIRERPELAGELLPDALLQRADAGAERVAQGERYYEANPRARPSGGVFFGVGSLILLAFNGLAIGTISGHFANLGLLGYLLEFIVGHGVLELFAIWVAGAAGFLLGKCLVAPGQVTRSEALVVNGRLAVRMVGAATLLLLVAGMIEGFISAGEKDLLFRVAVSGASILLLVAYLLNGARYLGDLKDRIQPSER
jgi:hypothetical protein